MQKKKFTSRMLERTALMALMTTELLYIFAARRSWMGPAEWRRKPAKA